MEMTNEQKTRELAEKVMGWVWGTDACGRECWLDCEGLPASLGQFDPFHVRDDADQLMGRLTDGQWLYFGTLIRRQIRESGDYIQLRRSLTRCLLMLTPAQISEAVWRATC